MRCEVLGFKDSKIANRPPMRFVMVRLVDQPDIIGEVPLSADSVVERGAVVDIQIKPRVYLGRLQFSAQVL